MLSDDVANIFAFVFDHMITDHRNHIIPVDYIMTLITVIT